MVKQQNFILEQNKTPQHSWNNDLSQNCLNNLAEDMFNSTLSCVVASSISNMFGVCQPNVYTNSW
jgi:hypothetical protein